MIDPRTDADLLAATATDPEAFGEFYERHEDFVLLFLLRRTRDPELAADLTAETFAQALCSASRFRPGPTPAIAWLVGIARNVLAMSIRRRRVEDDARRKLGMQRVQFDDEALARIERVEGDADVMRRLEGLPPDQRDAVLARVVRERDYAEIADELGCSESVVRKRVSRGLKELRSQPEGGKA